MDQTYLIDTHTHLYVDAFEEDRTAVIERAQQQGIRKFYLPNIDSASVEDMLALEAQYPEKCFAMMGLHPCSVKADFEEELAVVKEWLERRSFCAIGEIGIDLHWDKSTLQEQEKAFLTQIEWALEKDRPIVIHSRAATTQIIDRLREVNDNRLRGIFHCFGGNTAQAEAIIDLGFYLGIGGVLTFKKSGLDKTLKNIALDHIVLETDAPYLAPVPYRGKRNESSYLRLVAEQLAAIKNTTLQVVAEKTTANAHGIFRVSGVLNN